MRRPAGCAAGRRVLAAGHRGSERYGGACLLPPAPPLIGAALPPAPIPPPPSPHWQTPNTKDPLYAAYRDARGKQKPRGSAGELGDDTAAPVAISFGSASGSGVPVPPKSAAAMARAEASAAASTAAATAAAAPRARSILEMFERSAAWTLKELAEGMGLKEADIKAEVAEKCDYLRSGKFARHWLCKVALRTPRMPVPDAQAEAVRQAE